MHEFTFYHSNKVKKDIAIGVAMGILACIVNEWIQFSSFK